MNLFRTAGLLACIGMPLLGAAQTEAATATATLTITGTVAASCAISAAPLAFGTLSPSASNDATAALTVTCTQGTAALIKLGQGGNPLAGSTDAVPQRQMASGSNRLPYGIYSDSGRSVVAENSTGIAYTGTGNADTISVYGRVTAAAAAAAISGSYTDTVVVTVSY